MNPLRQEDEDAEHGGERPFLELTTNGPSGGGGGGGNGGNGSSVQRLLHRGPNNRFKVVAQVKGRSLLKVMVRDKFHGLVQMPWMLLLPLVASCYIGSWVFFAVWYYIIDGDCAMSADTFLASLYFSLITGTTIGYGTPELKFDGCRSAVFVIGAQAMVTTFTNAGLLGLMYAKFSRGSTRADRIIFSEKATVRKLGGNHFFSFQVVDGSCFGSYYDDPLIEAHVRVVAVRDTLGDDGDGVIPFQQCVMRLSQPNDELGGMLLLSLPNAIVHRIDAWSPLLPSPLISSSRKPSSPLSPPRRQCREPEEEELLLPSGSRLAYPAPPLRAADAESGMRTAFGCPVCGESYETMGLLRAHKRAAAVADRLGGHDLATLNGQTGESFTSTHALALNQTHVTANEKITSNAISWTQRDHSSCNHLEEEEEEEEEAKDEQLSSSALRDYYKAAKLEVVVLVEAIDLSTSNTIQARHSYSFLDGDILIDRAHVVPCTSRCPKQGTCIIDLDRFHATKPAPTTNNPAGPTITRSTPSIV